MGEKIGLRRGNKQRHTGIIAHHVDLSQRLELSLAGKKIVPMSPESLLRKLICWMVRLPDNRLLEFRRLVAMSARHGSPDTFQGLPEAALAQSAQVVLGSPPEIRIGKVERWLAILQVSSIGQTVVAVLVRQGTHDALLAQQQIEYDGRVQTPVPRIVVDEDGIDLEALRGVSGDDWFGKGLCKSGVVVLEDGRKRPDLRVGGDDVARCDDALEAVFLGHALAFVVVAAADEDRLVVQVRHGCKGRVRLHKHGCVEGDGQLGRELGDTVGFVFPTAIGEEDEGDASGLQQLEGFGCARQRVCGSEEDAVNAVAVLVGLLAKSRVS